MSEHPFDISSSLQVKAFSRSLESFKTAIVVGGTNIAEQVTNFGKIVLLSTLQIPGISEGLEIVFFLSYCSQNFLVVVEKNKSELFMPSGLPTVCFSLVPSLWSMIECNYNINVGIFHLFSYFVWLWESTGCMWRTLIFVWFAFSMEQRSEPNAGVDVVVAMSGRFIDHLQQGNTSLSRISFVILGWGLNHR